MGNGTVGNTPGESGRFSSPALLLWLDFRFYLAQQQLLGTRSVRGTDEDGHISAKYGQLIAHLKKERVIKIGQVNGGLRKD